MPLNPQGTPGEGVYDIDDNLYESVCIAGIEWMAENLRTSRYKDGSVIPTGLLDDKWNNAWRNEMGAYAIYPHQEANGIDSDSEMVDAYGKLYNYFTIKDDRGVCPAGWDVPVIWSWTSDGWQTLKDYLLEEHDLSDDYDDPNGVGNALRSCLQVNHPDGGECRTSAHLRWDETSNGLYSSDQFGFSALPSGTRAWWGNYSNLGTSASMWTWNTIHDVRVVYINDSRLWFSWDDGQIEGHAIRCIRRD